MFNGDRTKIKAVIKIVMHHKIEIGRCLVIENQPNCV